MDLIGVILLALLHLFSQPQDLKSNSGSAAPGLSAPPSVQSGTGDSGPELDPNGRA